MGITGCRGLALQRLVGGRSARLPVKRAGRENSRFRSESRKPNHSPVVGSTGVAGTRDLIALVRTKLRVDASRIRTNMRPTLTAIHFLCPARGWAGARSQSETAMTIR